MEYSNAFVCLLGIGTVFIGLICIIIICSLVSFFVRKFSKDEATAGVSVGNNPVSSAEEIPNRQEMIAAISVAIAEASGKDMSAIRIVSVKKIG